MKRKRWTMRLVGVLLVLAGLGGCKQQLFIEPGDYRQALDSAKIDELARTPHEPILPSTIKPGTPPATVLDPSRPPRYATLKELIAIAMENGNIGNPVTTSAGLTSDLLPTYTGGGTSGTDKISAFALDPAITRAEVERSLSKFDAQIVSSMTWNKTDQPTLTLQQSFSNGDSATLSNSLVKFLPTGGVAGLTFSTSYLNLSNPPAPGSGFVQLTTSYQPSVQFTFEQPLMQGFGVEVNQLLQSHPGSVLISGLKPSGGVGSEGILVTRIRTEQQRSQFDFQVNQMLLNVETAYWNLYSAYYNLAAQEEGMKQALEGYLYFEERARRGVARQQQAEQALAQYQLFRGQAITARGQVLTSERQLRGLLGMRSDDGTRMIPVDEPTLVPYKPDFYEMAAEALQYQPSLIIQRQELKARQLNLVLQRNLRKPDLRLLTNYTIAGLGPRLDGGGVGTNTTTSNGVSSTTFYNNNAFQSLIDNKNDSWQVGLRLTMPIGFRDANALVREAYLNMTRQYIMLNDAERKTIEYMTQQYRTIFEQQETIKARREQREALERYVRLDLEIRNRGGAGSDVNSAASFIANLLTVQRDLATATASEYQAIANYNIALASLEYAKGTIQRYNNVTVAEGPLPPHVQKKAADHFRSTTSAIKLREREQVLGVIGTNPFMPKNEEEIREAAKTAAMKADAAGLVPPAPQTPNGTVPGMNPLQPGANPLQPGANPLQPAVPSPAPAPTPAPAPKGPIATDQATPAVPPLVGSAQPGPLPQLQAADGLNGTGTFTQSGTLTLPPVRAPLPPSDPVPTNPASTVPATELPVTTPAAPVSLPR
ncbi:TolC family protein [Fimbriiglobus ruber]|uniref:Signal recognition particle receptor protein FtsY (Alpha subunit) n=1 Tax=Fimbriiglobus ruber TaxID=1908690 RepID=A0A225E9N8_9BACT|nr:TolC family protein [Fimbriiglobus ruber]OWK47448.1 Signal recognition particle receptor protein FtsY (alpha subunit) [Fimbriiglobus ruber]